MQLEMTGDNVIHDIRVHVHTVNLQRFFHDRRATQVQRKLYRLLSKAKQAIYKGKPLAENDVLVLPAMPDFLYSSR